MKRVLIIVYSAFAAIMLMNYFYYKSLYQKQVTYITELLDRQVQIVGLEVDSTNNSFVSDVTGLSLELKNIGRFFDKSKQDFSLRTTDKIKLVFTKYRDFITDLRIYDTNFHEYTLSWDGEKFGWIEGFSELFVQRELISREQLIKEEDKYKWYATILSPSGDVEGNIEVTVDYKKYFNRLFSEFNLKDYQWQWVLDETGNILFDNSEGDREIQYFGVDRIISELSDGNISNTRHEAEINGKRVLILSSYFSTQLLQRDLGIIFSAPTDFFQKYIILNSVFIVIATLIIVQLIIFVMFRFLRKQKRQIEKLSYSESMLMRMIEEMPVGVIIHNKNREIIKSNKVAAEFYSYQNESEMLGKIFPETSLPGDSDYFSKYLGGKFRPDQFVIIKKEIGEIILFRNSIPTVFLGEDASLEILIDVTMLESARKKEVKANVAKSEFLARMSYEIRTPLNGIIGMTDILNRYEQTPEIREVVSLLRRSTEVLLGIINDILDFSKIESGKMILDEAPFNLREEISYGIGLSRAHLGLKEVELSYSIDDNVPETLIGDSYRLRQVIVNLVNHAIFNTDRGEIVLKTRVKERKGTVIILQTEVADTGKGFDKASLKKIFGDFVDTDTLAVRSNEESAFGTIIAKQLVELMGGELAAISPSGLPGGSGTKVVFTIKVFTSEKQSKEIDVSPVNHASDIRALVVTGPHNRDEEVMAIIHRLGIQASVTSFNRATINQVRANYASASKYNLIVISDESEFDGFEVARTISENKLSHLFKIIIVSSNDRKGNYLKCLTLGVDHYLVKPVDQTEFFDALKESFTNLTNEYSAIDLDKLKRDLSILVVEDNKMNQVILVKMLKNLGYDCDIAEDGYEGFMRCEEKKYDMIFMDLLMPEMDGFESARRIIGKDRHALIVAFTADNMPETRRKAELSGIRDFIAKPVRLDDLKRLFAKHFNK